MLALAAATPWPALVVGAGPLQAAGARAAAVGEGAVAAAPPTSQLLGGPVRRASVVPAGAGAASVAVGRMGARR